MELLRTCDLARDLTKQLYAALESQDLEVCHDLLLQRGRAMDAFESAHRTASNQERESCRGIMDDLARVDEVLQERAKDILGMVTTEFREQLGLPAHVVHPTVGDRSQACLDRKA